MYENGLWDRETRQILNGTQSCIVRNNRCYKLHETVRIGAMTFTVVGVLQRELGYVVSKLHYHCGFATEGEFIDWWNAHNKQTPYDPSRMVHVHFIEEKKR